MADALQRLKAILAEVTDIHRAGAVLDWDQETFMPPGGVHNRAEQLSTLSEVAHRRFTTDEVGRLLDEAEAATANSPFDSDDASLVRVTRRDYDQARKLPPELVAAIAHASASARPHWQKARHESNFALFAPYLEKNLERGRQDISTHPFSTAFGPGDVRITTRVSRDFFNECLFGSIHEAGHGMYFQGIGPNLDRTPLWDGASPGVHESQSRLWENLVARSLPFWHHFFPTLRKTFPDSLKGVDAEAFYRAVNKSYPSFIRVEADEVTYNLHILLRFELENDMLEGKLKVADLPEAWNELFKSYVGLDVPNDREGVLQDIHWSFVGFAEFPGYTLGNIIGAQLMEKIRLELTDLDDQMERGEFGALLRWLQEHVYRHGRKFTPNELLER